MRRLRHGQRHRQYDARSPGLNIMPQSRKGTARRAYVIENDVSPIRNHFAIELRNTRQTLTCICVRMIYAVALYDVVINFKLANVGQGVCIRERQLVSSLLLFGMHGGYDGPVKRLANFRHPLDVKDSGYNVDGRLQITRLCHPIRTAPEIYQGFILATRGGIQGRKRALNDDIRKIGRPRRDHIQPLLMSSHANHYRRQATDVKKSPRICQEYWKLMNTCRFDTY